MMKVVQQFNQSEASPYSKAEFAQLFLDAVLSGSREQVSQFLDQYTASYYTLYQQPIVDVVLPRPFNNALGVAAKNNFSKIAAELLSRGAKLERSPDEMPVVDQAIMFDSVDVLKLLISDEMDKEKLRYLADVAIRNNANLCLREIEKILYTPEKIRYIETIFPTQTREAQEEFVWSLVNGGYTECIQHLKNRGFNFKLCCRSSWGGSFFTHCVEKTNIMGVKTLVDSGFNIQEADNHGDTPLSLAIMLASSSELSSRERQNPLEVVRVLLKHPRVDVNMLDKKGYSMLAVACSDDPQPEIVREFITKGANVNHTRSPVNESVLMTFFSKLNGVHQEGSVSEVFKVLLASGIDVNLTDSNGRSVWEYFYIFYEPSPIRLLYQLSSMMIEFGARVGQSEVYHEIANNDYIVDDCRQVLGLLHLGIEEDKKEECYPDIWSEDVVNGVSSHALAINDTKQTMLGAFLASSYMVYLNKQLLSTHNEEKRVFKLLFLVADRLLHKPSRLQVLPPLMWLMICKLARRYSFSIDNASVQKFDLYSEESKTVMTINPLISSLFSIKHDIKKGWSVKASAI